MIPEMSDRIRNWLLRQPRPTTVVVDDEKIVRIGASPRWRDLANSICNLNPSKLEAMSEDGEVLRVEVLGDSAESEVKEASGTEIAIPQVLSRDPETVRLTHFANLLARAHENGNTFVRDLMDLFLQRMDRMEERMEMKEAEAEAEFRARMEERMAAMPDDASKQDMMSTFFHMYQQSRAEKAAAKQAAKPSNGASAPAGWGGGEDG